jgi:thymidylate kinase
VSTLPRDVVIEFAGMPKSGKTTVLDIVSHRIRRAGWAVADFHGGGRYAPVGKKDLASLNLYLAGSALQYVATIGADERPPRFHLLDRGLNDRVIFSRALLSLGLLDDAHVAAIEQLAGLPDVRSKVDLCFVFTTTSELSLQREHANRLTAADGRIMNATRIEALRIAAAAFSADVPSTENPQVIPIDTARHDGAVRATAQSALESIAKVVPEDVACSLGAAA